MPRSDLPVVPRECKICGLPSTATIFARPVHLMIVHYTKRRMS